MDYLAVKRELLNQEAAKAARIEAINMLARAKTRAAFIEEHAVSELNQNTLDPARIAFIAAREFDDGFKSDVYVVPDRADAPMLSVPCSLDTRDAVAHYNEEGKGEVNLTHSKSSRVAVNIKTISKLETTPDAITSALVHWSSSYAPQGLPVALSYDQINDIITEINIAQLRAVAEQDVLTRHPRAMKPQLAAG